MSKVHDLDLKRVEDFYRTNSLATLYKDNGLLEKEKEVLFELFVNYKSGVENSPALKEIESTVFETCFKVIQKYKKQKLKKNPNDYRILESLFPNLGSFLKKNNTDFASYTTNSLASLLFLSMLSAKFYLDSEILENNEESHILAVFIDEVYNKFTTNLYFNLFYFEDDHDKKVNQIQNQKLFIKKIIYNALIKLKNLEIIKINTKNTILPNSEKKTAEAGIKTKKTINYVSFSFSKPFAYLGNVFLTSRPKLKKLGNVLLIGGCHFSSNHHLFAPHHAKNKVDLRVELENFIDKFSQQRISFDKPMFEEVKKIINWKSPDLLVEGMMSKTHKNLSNLNYLKYKKHWSYKNLQKKFSNLSNIYLFLNLENFLNVNDLWNLKIFFSFFFDFRSRLYLKSLISPYGPWFFRFIFNYGTITKEEIIESYKSYNKDNNSNIDLVVFKNERTQLLNDFGINCAEDSIFNIISWIALSFGKICKNTIGKNDNYKEESDIFTKNGRIHINTLIKIGFQKMFSFLSNENWFENEKDIDDKELAEIVYYLKIVKDLSLDKMPLRYIIKDTTASVFQHGGKVLGYKDHISLKLTNIDSGDFWYDSYQPIVKKLLETSTNKNLDYAIKRKTLKKSIMVKYYNATFRTSFKYFLENIDHTESTHFSELYKSQTDSELKNKSNYIPEFFYNDYIEEFKKIYKKLDWAETELFFKTCSKDFTNSNTNSFIVLDDFTLDLRYFTPSKNKNQRIIVFEDGKRFTIVDYDIVLKDIDFKKTKRARLPNTIHALDADYSRKIIREFDFPIICIHDAFLIPIDKIDYAILVANKNINFCKPIIEDVNQQFKKITTYSKTIFI